MEETKTRKKKRKYRRRSIATPKPEANLESAKATVPIEPLPMQRPVAVKRFTKRFIMLILAGSLVVFGIIGFISYIITLNMFLGAPAVIMGIGGFLLFKYYWSKGGDFVTEQIGQPSKEPANCLNIYPERILFENIDYSNGNKPDSYPQECLNDHKKYWVNICLAKDGKLEPFNLPDQQYYDPTVFAERPLELPAHRRIFRRKEKLAQTIKTLLLVVTIIALWLLIITTT